MPIDFTFEREPAYRVACLPPFTEYKESAVRARFERIHRWARDHGLRTGRWFFLFRDEPSDDRYQVAIEVKGRARGDSQIRLRTLPASRVGSVTFDPHVVAPRVAYFGITAWLRWERSQKTFRTRGSYREVYDGNPWTDRKVEGRATVQVLVR